MNQSLKRKNSFKLNNNKSNKIEKDEIIINADNNNSNLELNNNDLNKIESLKELKEKNELISNLINYMFHAIKLLNKAVKKSQSIEVQKLSRKLKLLSESNLNQDSTSIELKENLIALKSVSIDSIPIHLLHTRLPSLRFLHSILPSILASLPIHEPLSFIEPTTPMGKARNKVLANKLIKEAWLEISRAIGKKCGEISELVQIPETLPIDTTTSSTSRLELEPIVIEGKRLSKRALRTAKNVAKAGLIINNASQVTNSIELSTSKAETSRKGKEGNINSSEINRSESHSVEKSFTAELEDSQLSVNLPSTLKVFDKFVVDPLVPSLKRARKETRLESSSKKVEKPIQSSAFLPSLASGYISYSDSDDEAEWVKEGEKVDKVERKNRRGQRARQAIWEQKYGSGANHVARVNGSRPAESKGVKSRKMHSTSSTSPNVYSQYTPFNPLTSIKGSEFNPNTQPVLERVKSREELEMHPSWVAKRRLKEVEEDRLRQAPKGKKLIFS